MILGLSETTFVFGVGSSLVAAWYIVGPNKLLAAFGQTKAQEPAIIELPIGEEEIWILENFAGRKVHVFKFDMKNQMAYAREIFKYGPKGEVLNIPIFPVVPGENLTLLNPYSLGKHRVWVWSAHPNDAGVTERYDLVGRQDEASIGSVTPRGNVWDARLKREMKEFSGLRAIAGFDAQKNALKTEEEKTRSFTHQMEQVMGAVGKGLSGMMPQQPPRKY